MTNDFSIFSHVYGPFFLGAGDELVFVRLIDHFFMVDVGVVEFSEFFLVNKT